MLLTAVIAAVVCVPQVLADASYTSTYTSGINKDFQNFKLDGTETTSSGNGLSLSGVSGTIEISGTATGSQNISNLNTASNNGGYGGRVKVSNVADDVKLIFNDGVEVDTSDFKTKTGLQVTFDNASFYGGTFNFDVEIGNGGARVNGGSTAPNNFTGKLTGAGTMYLAAGNAWNFTGDISSFTGTWSSTGSDNRKALTLGGTGIACGNTGINGNIGRSDLKELNVTLSYNNTYNVNGNIYTEALTVGNTGTAVIKGQTVVIDRLTINSGATASLGAAGEEGETVVKIANTITNNGTLNVNKGLRFDSSTISKVTVGGELEHETHGFRVGETKYTLVTGGTINLGEDFKLYMDSSATALDAEAISTEDGALTYTGTGRNSIYEITSAHTDVVEYGNGIAATAGATGFLMEAGTKLAISNKTVNTSALSDGIEITGNGATISLTNKATLDSNVITGAGEAATNYTVNDSKLVIKGAERAGNIRLENGATLSLDHGGNTSSLTATSIYLTGGSLIEMRNGNAGKTLNSAITVDGTGYISGSVFAHGGSDVQGTIKGNGTLGLVKDRDFENTWKVSAKISDGDTEGDQLKVVVAGGKLNNGQAVANGANNVTLYGANDYTGGTEIQGGTLVAANNKALGEGKVTMLGGTLQQSTDLTVSAMEYRGGTVTNSGKVLMVTGALDAKATLSITGAGDVSIGTLNLADGTTLSTEGNLTLSNLTLNLSSYAVDQTHTLVSSSGTLDFKGSLAAYDQQTVGDYISQVEMSGDSIVLTFAAKPQGGEDLDLMVGSASLNAAGDVLTLNLSGNLTAGCNVDLILSDAALADIAGMTGLVDLSLVATNGTFTSVAGEANFVNVSFYNGAYTGEVGGKFRVEYIPEPTTATLSLLALAGLAARRRRR